MDINNIVKQFQACSRVQFNGKLDVETTNGYKWSFYYRLGRLVWATGGVHPVRCWRRQLTQHCPQVNVNRLQLPETQLAIKCWEYHVLSNLYKQQKLKLEQFSTIVDGTIAELLFDVIQQATSSSLSFNCNQEYILNTPLTFSSVDMFLQQMQQAWVAWCDAGLANLSPNSAPILRRSEQLQQQVSVPVYQNFVTLMQGKDTLRDLAVRMKQDVLQLTRSLPPYIGRGFIELVQVPDLSLPVSRTKTISTAPPLPRATGPLIACIDDSPQTCQMLEQIITSKGLRFMSIQDSVQALPTLIERKPDLIFLDLVMPVANGYEICAQLRRVSLFASTPVIILTGSDGLVDRVRAKVVGASDFLGKPVEAHKVLAVVSKYLSTSSPSLDTANFQFKQVAVSH